jgi:hypothetical protein
MEVQNIGASMKLEIVTLFDEVTCESNDLLIPNANVVDVTETEESLELIRNNKRKESRYPAMWRTEGFDSSSRAFKGITEDISLSGVSMYTSRLIPQGSRLHIKMQTYVCGVYKDIDAIVEVKHSAIAKDRYKCGMQILKLTDGCKCFLERYINGLNPHKKNSEHSPV